MLSDNYSATPCCLLISRGMQVSLSAQAGCTHSSFGAGPVAENWKTTLQYYVGDHYKHLRPGTNEPNMPTNFNTKQAQQVIFTSSLNICVPLQGSPSR
jgi:hypothetical protein